MNVNVTSDGPRPESLPWIESLVQLDTTSRNSNLGLIEMARDHCRRLGLATWLTHDKSGRKANLFATLPATDGAVHGGTVLSGHTDVVPVDGQQWSTNPFVPTIRDEKLYGRGTADMKSFIGVALALLPQFAAATRRAPLHLALSFDEEIGCVGAPLMIEQIKSRGIAPAHCLVGEPTGMKVVVAHKGINAWRCKVRGRAAHSSLTPRGVNAVEYAARLICFIRDLAERLQAQGPFDDAFDVPFATAQTGVVRGGVALNLIPESCEVEFELRNLPGMDAQALLDEVKRFAFEQLLPRMRAVGADADILFERIATAPALSANDAAELTRLVRALTGDHVLRKVAYGTEAGLFQEAGVASVICGPGHIEQAHRPDEFIELAQIRQCEVFLQKLCGARETP